MNRLYLISFSPEYDRDKLTTFFDTQGWVIFWFYNLPNSVFVASPKSSQEIYNIIVSRFGEHQIFINEVVANRHFGRLPTEHWKFFSQYERKS